jgi:GNAT superfamily N-acetyltransferase
MVTRQPIDVRRAGAGDLDDLLQLWALAREDVGPLGRPSSSTSVEAIRPRLRAALLGDDIPVVIARWEGRPAGYTLVRVVPVAALLEGLAVQIEQLFVVPEFRRHGVARALLACVTGIADRAGADQIVSSAPPSARDSHRFLARLGFSPVVVRRVVSTSVLRRKLAGECRRGGLEDLLSRRRSLRARAGWPRRPEPAPAPSGEVGADQGEDVELCPVSGPASGVLTAPAAEPQPQLEVELEIAAVAFGRVDDEVVGEQVPLALGHEAVSGSGTSVGVGGAP